MPKTNLHFNLLANNFTTSTHDFKETMSQAPTQHTNTKKPLLMVSDSSSGESESDGWEFGSRNDHDNNIEDGDDEEGNNGGDKDDNEEEGGRKGDEMEKEEYDDGHRVEMVDC